MTTKKPSFINIENYPEKAIFVCNNCVEKCQFQIQITKTEFVNAPGTFRNTKTLVSLGKKQVCTMVPIDSLQLIQIFSNDPRKKHICPNCEGLGYLFNYNDICHICSLCDATGKLTTEELLKI